MIYEVRTLEIGSKLYKASGYPTIDMRAVIQDQTDNSPESEKKDWAYSLYFSNDPQVCAGYIPDCEPEKYLIEITLNRPIEYIFTDDPCFFSGGVLADYMKSTVVPKTSEAILKHTKKTEIAEFHYPVMPFMQELGNKHFAFSDIMAIEKGEGVMLHEIIIPHSLLIGDVFTQRKLDYRMNDKMNGFEWIEK